MKYVFHPEALTEYSEAVQYYTEQRVEIAQAFINAIEDTVYRIRESPTRYAVIDDEVRRCMARKFPYGILSQSSKTTFLFWRLCIVAENRDIGKVVNRRSCQQPNRVAGGFSTPSSHSTPHAAPHGALPKRSLDGLHPKSQCPGLVTQLSADY
jgi:toxin ParE1/3/4